MSSERYVRHPDKWTTFFEIAMWIVAMLAGVALAWDGLRASTEDELAHAASRSRYRGIPLRFLGWFGIATACLAGWSIVFVYQRWRRSRRTVL